jgi:uncharacterized membrane protein YeaQ/YmgE (transglycosylase-associated protein family)
MTKLLGLIGATAGSALGWWAGAAVGTTTAFMHSMVGTGVGLYFGRKVARQYAP